MSMSQMGTNFNAYAVGAAVLLRYAHRVLEELRIFCSQRMLGLAGGPMILPMPQNRHQFIVRAADYGLE